MRYEFINEIPDNLDPQKQYTTKIVDLSWKDGSPIAKLEFIGEVYDKNNPQCLMPVSINPTYKADDE